MFLSKHLVIFFIIFTFSFCSSFESFSQTNSKLVLGLYDVRTVFTEYPVLRFHAAFYRYFHNFTIDSNSRIKFLDGTYSKVNEENVRSHLEYKISSTYKSGQYFTIDTLEQFFAFNTSMLHNLGFGILNNVEPDTWIADVNGRKFKISESFYLRSIAKSVGFHPTIDPTLGKYIMFSEYSLRDSSVEIQMYETIQDSLLYSKIGTITAKIGSLITLNNQKIYITEYTMLQDEIGNMLLLQDFEVSTEIDIDYFYHESSKKYIALKMIRLKN